jgi:hypothetical protein
MATLGQYYRQKLAAEIPQAYLSADKLEMAACTEHTHPQPWIAENLPNQY